MLLEDLSDTSALDTKIEMLTMELNDIGILIREHSEKCGIRTKSGFLQPSLR